MDVKGAKERLAALLRENDEIVNSAPDVEGTIEINEERKSAFSKNLTEARALRETIDLAEGHDELKSWAAGEAKSSLAMAAAAQIAAGAATGAETKTVGQMFLDSEEFKSLAGGRRGIKMATPWELEGADFSGRAVLTKAEGDVHTTMPAGSRVGGGAFGTHQRDPFIALPQRQRRVRDLFPVQTTSANAIEYLKETGFTNGASVVPERTGTGTSAVFGLKPRSSLAFEWYTANVRTIAHWVAAHRNTLADEPALRALIDSELLYGLRLREDQQILYGAGTGEDLLGIMNTPDVQTYAQSAGPATDNKADAIRRAATKAYLAEYPATGVVLHANDWEDMELTKNTSGDYLLAVSIAVGGEQRLWRLPLVDTPAINEGEALVGAFGLGAQLYDREVGSIRTTDSHEDFFVRNAVVILAEERLGLATKRPEAFVVVTF